MASKSPNALSASTQLWDLALPKAGILFKSFSEIHISVSGHLFTSAHIFLWEGRIKGIGQVTLEFLEGPSGGHLDLQLLTTQAAALTDLVPHKLDISTGLILMVKVCFFFVHFPRYKYFCLVESRERQH